MADVSRVVPISDIDPAAVAGAVVQYAKSVSGVAQPFVRLSDGTVVQLGAGGGGVPAWAAGSYAAGAAVTRGPYMWRANAITTEDPCIVEGNLGLGADWSVVTTAGSGMVQGSGQILMIAGVNGARTTAYRQSVNNGFLGKMLIVDISLTGIADWMTFGIFDSSLAQTSNTTDQAGFYGQKIDIFNGNIVNIINGAGGGTSPYSNANATNAGSTFARWYLSMIQNGANWDLSLYRDTRVANSPLTNPPTNNNSVLDMQPIAQFINVARPAFTNWRFAVGAGTGGSAATFKVNAAYTRNIISGNWSALSKLPTGLG